MQFSSLEGVVAAAFAAASSGAQYLMRRNLALRNEWDCYHPSVFGDRSNIDQVTFGVPIGF